MKESSAGPQDAAGESGLALARSPYVIDTSVAVKWYIPEARSAEARAYIGEGVDRHAPDYLLAEAASVVLKRVRSRDPKLRLTLNEGQMVIAATRVSPIQFHETRSLIDPGIRLGSGDRRVPLRRPVRGLGSAARRPACHRRCKAIQKDAGQPTCRPGTLGRGRAFNRVAR